MNRFVVAVTATFRRPEQVRRLLKSLEAQEMPLAVLVVDNAGDPETKAAVEEAAVEAHWLCPGANLGCGGGLAFGERAALERFGEKATHLWLLDDDTAAEPGALKRLVEAMEFSGAALACPMIIDRAGNVGWPPGLQSREPFRTALEGRPLAEFLARHGEEPIPFSWATGISLLAAREAVERLGPHRTDFWIRGEDLEFSLRLTARGGGIFVPRAVVAHLPPPAGGDADGSERRKHRAMLQNAAYIALRLPHGRRILRNLPGNFWRYCKTWGARSVPEALAAVWRGGAMALPAGAPERRR